MRFTLQTHSTSGRTTPQIKILSSSEIITIPDGENSSQHKKISLVEGK
jgi:hypothetical protein